MTRLKTGAAVTAALAALATLPGCANLAPDFQRPAAPISANWPATSASVTDASASPLAGVDWQAFFTDTRLRQTIELALRNNRDLRVAALNIEKARAQYRISEAARWPTVDASASQSTVKPAIDLALSGTQEVTHQYGLGVGFSSFELDFFGRVANLKNQALEQYLATEDARRTLQISLVAETASTWLTLAADLERLRLAQATQASQQQSLTLTQRTYEAGVATALDLNQARMAVEAARGDVARYLTAVAQDRNALALVVGAPLPDELQPTTLGEVSTLTEAVAAIPAGIPSETLLQRPDVVQAERLLRAANASIGAARAAFFPSLSLTVFGGFGSSHLDRLFSAGNGTWTFAPQLSLPIFDAGSNQANLDAARADQKIRIAQYEKAVQSAFRETSDALAVRATISEQSAAQRAQVDAATESHRLSRMRFEKGVDSYLPVLDAQRSQYAAEQGLISIQLARQSNVVTLYKVFGGGWKSLDNEGTP